MKPPANYALFYEFDMKAPRKRQVSCSATLLRPSQRATGEWACRFLLRGIAEEEHTIYGADPLQALMLALEYLRFALDRIKKRGVAIRYQKSAEEIDLQLYFRGRPC